MWHTEKLGVLQHLQAPSCLCPCHCMCRCDSYGKWGLATLSVSVIADYVDINCIHHSNLNRGCYTVHYSLHNMM